MTDPATDQPRARQNVVFELGYFFGKLGHGRPSVHQLSGGQLACRTSQRA
ncbi:MAG: nucleotide-binding protein [Pseudonocardiales bacterium]|nr:nucleotide-binding protein [Pseudonocardiales bacterium]